MINGGGWQHMRWLIWQQGCGRGMGKCVVVGGKVTGGGEQQQKLKIST